MLNIELTYDPAIPLLTTYPREMDIYLEYENMETCAHKNLYMNVHSSIILIVQKWQQPKYPCIDE